MSCRIEPSRIVPSAADLCVFINGVSPAWESAIQATWGSNTLVASAEIQIAEPLGTRLPRLQLDAVPGVGTDQPHFQALSLWSTLTRRLSFNTTRSSDVLDSCHWLMHVDGRSYVNVKRIAERLQCLQGLQPEYYALSAMIGASHVALADEVGGYIFSRKQLLQLRPGWVERCADELSNSSDAQGFGWEWPSGFYVSLCLWRQERLRSQRLGDPEQEVLMHSIPRESPQRPLMRLRRLHPAGHCVLLVSASLPALPEIHRRVRLVSPLDKDAGREAVRAEVGCFVPSLMEPEALAPPWSYRVARAIARCPLKSALASRGNMGVTMLKQELLRPSKPGGSRCRCTPPAQGLVHPDANHRRNAAAGGPRCSCCGDLGQAIPSQLGATRRADYRRKDATLSLRGDLDMRHPKFNALRFIYMWLTIAIHHAAGCRFWMKADMDAYVNVPRLLQTLSAFNASEKVYAGHVTYSHGPGYDSWNTFAHGIGYILSRAALQAAVPGLRRCMEQLLGLRLEAIEDMLLGACLRKVGIRPKELGHMIYDFRREHLEK
ncbi:unnamed protein product, partial [Effrenium voratum]